MGVIYVGTHHNYTGSSHLDNVCHADVLGLFCISKYSEKCVHTSFAQFHTMCLNLSCSVFAKPMKRDAIGNLYQWSKTT